ncbi:AI-2E family transporter [Flaviflexus huanghaiensis]|uniref:AI-2E family transporter n=1 Tax=Flaviflexus huanghaiensis TaxID=1111473 RepID=UPI003BA86165
MFVTVFLAFVATSVLRPITDLLARWLPRALAMILSLVLVIGAFAGLIAFVVISVRSEWDDLASQFSEGIDSIFELVENAPLPWNVSSDEPQQWISQTIDDGIAWIQENTGEITSQVMSGASSIGLGIMILSLATLITVFFLMSGAQMWLWFLNELPDKHRDTTHRAAMAGWLAFSGYARGTVIIGLINGALAFLLLIVLGVPLAAPLAVLVVIGTFIPLIGAPAAMIIATIVALAANGIAVAFIVLIGIALIGQLEGNVLQPLIMGKQVSLHPTVIALGVAAGTLLAGLFGAIIAIPILSVLWAVYKVLRKQDPPRQTLPDVDKDELLET